MSSLDNSLSHKGKKEGIRQWNSNAKLLIMLRRIVIIKLENFMLLLKGLENGDKTNWKYLNQQLSQRIKDLKVVGKKTNRPTIRKPISWMDWWREIQWIACLEENFNSQGEIILQKWMWWKWDISFLFSMGE